MKNDVPLELTIKAVVLGVLISAVLAAANAYLGLFAGMTVSASIPAAVVSMGVLKMFRRSGILENNIVQTAGSAGESLAAGVIFTLPALLILGSWEKFNYRWVTMIAALGGLLGVLFTIPLRRALIIEQPLKFPEGVATAEVLKAGERGGASVGDIIRAAVAGGIFKLCASGFRLFPEILQGARGFGGGLFYFGSNLSPALLSVGYIVGFNIAALVFLGGIANWLIAVPFAAHLQPWPQVNGTPLTALDWAWQIWSEKTRYIGVGGMLAGGLWAIWQMRKSMFSGISSGLKAYKKSREKGIVTERTERDIPMQWVCMAVAVAGICLFGIYHVFTGRLDVSITMTVPMLVLGFVFSAVAAYMAGVVGSSNNPISGVTIATVAVSALLLYLLMGKDSSNGPAAAIIVGSVICCAAAIAGDNMQDLKTGYIVGATPWKQQVAQILGTVTAALVIAPVLMLLQEAYGFAGHSSAKEGVALAAPQANLMASVARGVFTGDLPWGYVFTGACVAVLVITGDVLLEKRKAVFRMPVLAVTIGFYLPLELSVPIFAGGIIKGVIERRNRMIGRDAVIAETAERRGTLFASGLITGEALTGILLAIPIVITGNPKALEMINKPFSGWVGLLLLAAIAAWLTSVALSRQENLPEE